MAANFLGFGTRLLGKRAFRADGSYVTTHFVTAAGLPLLPLQSLRVRPAAQRPWARGAVAGEMIRYQILERFRPFCWAQVACIYWRAALLLGALLVLAAACFPASLQVFAEFQRYTHGPVAITLLFLCLIWPICLCSFLLLMSRRRAHPPLDPQ